MSGHKWSKLQLRRFKRTMRLRKKFNSSGKRPPEQIVYRGVLYRRVHGVEVVS